MSLAVTDESGESSAISNSTIMSQVAEGLAEMYDALPVPLNFDLTVAEALYVQLYVDTDEKTGKQTSRKERDAKGYTNSGLIYGEVEFGPFALSGPSSEALFASFQAFPSLESCSGFH